MASRRPPRISAPSLSARIEAGGEVSPRPPRSVPARRLPRRTERPCDAAARQRHRVSGHRCRPAMPRGEAAVPQSGCALAGALPSRRVHRGFPEGADGAARGGCAEPLARCDLAPHGRKELLGFQIGARESAQNWRELPAEHWDQLRTTNPIESVFATVRHRTVPTRGALSQKTARLMVFTLVRAASKTWRKLNRTPRLPRVTEGGTFTDGVTKNRP